MFNVGDVLAISMLDEVNINNTSHLSQIVSKISDKEDSNFNDLIQNVTFH